MSWRERRAKGKRRRQIQATRENTGFSEERPEEESNGGCSGATRTESREIRSRRDRETIWRDEEDKKEKEREKERERDSLRSIGASKMESHDSGTDEDDEGKPP